MSIFKIDRRELMVMTALSGTGLLLGCSLFKKKGKKREPGDPFELNAYVMIAADDTVKVLVPEAEMGQGILTSAAMIVVEELEADWSKVKVEHAPPRMKEFGWQITGASTSIRDGFAKMRVMGATAREMLLSAASELGQVPRAELRAEKSAVIHDKSGQRWSFGQLAEGAVEETAPAEPKLKDWRDMKLVGRSIPRLDMREKVTGEAIFGIDVRRPSMLVAQVERPAILGAKVKSIDDKAALAVPGVRQVVQLPTGVAVLADHFWAAKKGREALVVQWDGGAVHASNVSIRESYLAALEQGKDAVKTGDADGVIAKSEKKFEATYELPFLAHATMEPMNCTVELSEERCEIWTGTQSVSQVLDLAKEVTGLDPENIIIHTPYLGGGFGRRSKVDYVQDALHAARTANKPVKVVWTREDDMRAGWYRPAAISKLTAALDEKGMPLAWKHQIVGAPILGLREGMDPFSIEGAEKLPYAIPNIRVSYAPPADQSVPSWFWRSVGYSLNGFVVETFVDELAVFSGQDPVEYRRKLMNDSPRPKKVLEIVAEKSGWGGSLAEGHALGCAVFTSFGSHVAQIADVSLEDGRPRVHRVWCAIDCGEIVNPDTIAAQMQGGIVYGLSAALYGVINIDKGRVRESNFHDYPILRISEAPVVETHLVAGGAPLGGVGEPGVPPIAPAVANAMFKLTGKRMRGLPLVRA
jgi:isoquinoline 1-oxidoreductase beta subunit